MSSAFPLLPSILRQQKALDIAAVAYVKIDRSALLPCHHIIIIRGCPILACGVSDKLRLKRYDMSYVQLAKKHADKMPIKGSLSAVAAASRLALGPLQAEVADLRRSLAAIQRTLSALPQDDTDSFRQVSWIDPYAERFFTSYSCGS